MCSLITRLFDEKYNKLLSEEVLPSIGDIFWSMANHFSLENYEFEPDNLVNIYTERLKMCGGIGMVFTIWLREMQGGRIRTTSGTDGFLRKSQV